MKFESKYFCDAGLTTSLKYLVQEVLDIVEDADGTLTVSKVMNRESFILEALSCVNRLDEAVDSHADLHSDEDLEARYREGIEEGEESGYYTAYESGFYEGVKEAFEQVETAIHNQDPTAIDDVELGRLVVGSAVPSCPHCHRGLLSRVGAHDFLTCDCCRKEFRAAETKGINA